jgi:hypothetical protein
MRLAHGPIAFTNLNGQSNLYRNKAIRVLTLLGSHPDITAYLNARNCDITLEQRLVASPANIIDNGPAGVSVTLAAYYFEDYSIGYVLGMLCHEFGIHKIANGHPLAPGDDQARQGVAVPVPGVNANTINTVGAVSADHAIGVMQLSVRHGVYRAVVLHMADLLLGQVNDQVAGAAAQDVTDLLDCFLMDLASIAATNDHRLHGVPFLIGSQQVRQDIADAYQAYLALVMADQAVSPGVLGPVSEVGVRSSGRPSWVVLGG